MKAGLAITLLLLSACALAAHARKEERHSGGNNHDDHHNDKHDDKHYKQPYKPKYYYKPEYKPKQEYYCSYFYYDYGHCPSGNWYDTMQSAVTEFSSHSHDVYGCSFGNQYNYGYQSYPTSQGGYICFKYERSIKQFWSWFYGNPTYSDFATPESGYCHYKNLKSYNLPSLAYTYHY